MTQNSRKHDFIKSDRTGVLTPRKGQALLIRLGSVLGKMSGEEYAYQLIKEALQQRFQVTDLAMHKFFREVRPPILRLILRRMLAMPFLIFYSHLAMTSYDLVFISWTPRIPLKGHLAYIAPFAGAAEHDDGLMSEPYSESSNNIHLAVRTIEKILPSRFRRSIYLDPTRSKFLIACSQYTRHLIRRQLGKDAFVVYPPVPVHQYRCPHSKKNQVVSLGRVSPEKEFHIIGRIGPRIPEAKFILVGQHGLFGPAITRKIESSFRSKGLVGNFSYQGWVSGAAKTSLLEQSKVIFHPARCEPFGIVIAEGMAAGCIPVAHASGGIPEFVPNDYLFDTPEEALKKIHLAISKWTPERGQQMRRLVLRFSEDRFMAEIAEIAQRISSNPTCRQLPRP